MLSCTLIIPAALLDRANALGEAMGHGPASYSVPLSATGDEPATHYGLHTWAAQTFVDMLDAAGQGVMPEGLDYPAQDFAAVVGGLVASIRGDAAGHFVEVCEAEGLAVVRPPAD